MLGVQEEGALRVRVSVDEAGTDDVAGGIDCASGLRCRQVADRSDRVSLDPDVGANALRTRAVDHGSTDYDDVEHWPSWLAGDWGVPNAARAV